MGISISVGGESFEELRSDGCYYVDKSELIYDLVKAKSKVTLFTRPRRFGKTLTLRMLESFFKVGSDSKAMFEGLDIMKHEEFCTEWMNQYPVLFVSFKDVEGLSFESAYKMLTVTLASLCKERLYLAEDGNVSEEDRIVFHKLSSREADEGDIRGSLKTIMRMMMAVHRKPVILLIDEYDVPLAKAEERKEGGERYYPRMLEVIRSIMSIALKSNDYLKFCVVTGCLRIAKESIFTGVNNFKSYSVLDRRFGTYFGFTEKEVEELLSAAGLENRMELVRTWYDGYIFGNNKVFCPWDVINYVTDAMVDPDMEPENYWKNTSGNGIIRSFVERTDFQVKKKFETLLNGGSITQTISDELTYDSLHDTEDHLWGVLLMAGYLTKADPQARGKEIAVRIPNQEIATIFEDTVVKYFSDHVDAAEQKSMMEHLWAGDEAGASKAISMLLWQTISYMDYHEDYYHAFLAGIFVGRGYEVESNKERGLGRPDIKLTDDKGRRVLIIEAKKSGSKNQMEHDCKKALQQIVDEEYAKDLDEYEVFCYGVAFFQKCALVKKL